MSDLPAPVASHAPDAEAPAPKQTERPHPLTPLIRGWIVLVAIVLGFGREFLPDGSQPEPTAPGTPPWWVFVAVFAGVVVLSALAGLVSWYFTKFVIDDDELRIETGWLNTTSKRISFTRIQSVDIIQPMAARLFGLVELKIDAGGGQDGGARLRYLKRDRAYALRNYLLARAHGSRTTLDEASAGPVSGVLQDLAADDEVIVRIDPGKIILAALLSLEFTIPLIMLVAYFVVTAVTPLPMWSGVVAIIPMIMGLFGFVSKRVITQFNYTLAQTRNGLRITRGLTNLVSQSVPAKRIQGISIHQPITWKPLGLYRVQVDILGSGASAQEGEGREDVGLLMPAGSAADVRTALAHIWPGVSLEAITLQTAPKRARWLRPVGWRYLRFGYDDQVAISESGWMSQTRTIIPHARTQSVSIDQGPLQRRLHLADVAIHSTPGPVNFRARHLDESVARAYALSQLERARDARRRARTDASLPVADASPEAAEPDRPWPIEDPFAPDWRESGQT